MPELKLIPTTEFDRVRAAGADRDATLGLLADMCRLTRSSPSSGRARATSGRASARSTSSSHLLFEELNVRDVGFEDPGRDVFFSSKGHDVPGLYAALHCARRDPVRAALASAAPRRPRRPPRRRCAGIEANSGSLGMGVSKGRGIAWAKRHLGLGGRVVVMLGDGELQEGQNWEAFQGAADERLGRLWVIVDRNELQSDKPTDEIVGLGDLEEKLRSFGWEARSCDGHDHAALADAFASFRDGDERPKALVARTMKGKGVSFMEHPRALREGGGTYRWHAGAPDDESFERAFAELAGRIDSRLDELGLEPLSLEPVAPPEAAPPRASRASPRAAPGRARRSRTSTSRRRTERRFVELGAAHEHLVVLDADLASDCRVRTFELTYPERFLECGIAEQDMVSAAAGIARHGLLPVVNSFASFLASRANEQIYNQASEKTKVVYALHYAGLIPAGPGKSHQSVRDVSLLAALPNMTIVQPANAEETAELLRWAVEDAEESVALRLVIGPSPRRIELAATLRAQPGRGTRPPRGRRRGALRVRAGDAARGAARLRVARAGRRRRRGRGHAVAEPARRGLARRTSSGTKPVFVLEDHAPVGALGDAVRRELDGRRVDRVRRRGLARVRDAAGGAPLPRARRRVAGGEDPAPARDLMKKVWLVLSDPFPTRVFVDCGIVSGLEERLPGRVEAILVLPRDEVAVLGRPARGRPVDERR